MRKNRILQIMEKVKGILPGDHSHRLIDAVKMTRGPYIEIGVLCGASTLCIALGAEDDEKVISVDPFRWEYLSDMAKGVVREVLGKNWKGDSFYAAWEKQVKRHAHDRPIFPVEGDRLEKLGRVKSLLGGKKAGFLFLDGLHDTESVRAELDAYLPLMRKGAIVAFHDYSSTGFGVYAAVQEALKDGRLEMVVDNYLFVARVR